MQLWHLYYLKTILPIRIRQWRSHISRRSQNWWAGLLKFTLSGVLVSEIVRQYGHHLNFSYVPSIFQWWFRAFGFYLSMVFDLPRIHETILSLFWRADLTGGIWFRFVSNVTWRLQWIIWIAVGDYLAAVGSIAWWIAQAILLLYLPLFRPFPGSDRFGFSRVGRSCNWGC